MDRVLVALSLVALAFAAGACKTERRASPAAMETCKAAKDAVSCKTCCIAVGASGHLFMSGGGCRCL